MHWVLFLRLLKIQRKCLRDEEFVRILHRILKKSNILKLISFWLHLFKTKVVIEGSLHGLCSNVAKVVHYENVRYVDRVHGWWINSSYGVSLRRDQEISLVSISLSVRLFIGVISRWLFFWCFCSFFGFIII